MVLEDKKSFRIKSFVGRNSRTTDAQQQAYDSMWPQFGLPLATKIDYSATFGRSAPCYLEIGFGMGASLLAVAALQSENNFIGVETHRPGHGAVLQAIAEQEITNLRLYHGDVIDVLEKCIPDASLAGVQIFFPDPWPKRRHHERRLIQSEFIKLVVSKLQANGILHLATDWEHYAKHMMQVLNQESQLQNVAGVGQFAARSPQRPIVTKFEKRALHAGRDIWDLQFIKK